MRQPKYLHIASLILAYLASAILLVADNTSFSLAISQEAKVNAKKQEQVANPNASDSEEEGGLYLQELSVEAVFSILHIQLNYPLYLSVNLDFPLIEEIPFFSEAPRLAHSYFVSTFCHIIAINAP